MNTVIGTDVLIGLNPSIGDDNSMLGGPDWSRGYSDGAHNYVPISTSSYLYGPK